MAGFIINPAIWVNVFSQITGLQYYPSQDLQVTRLVTSSFETL